MALDIVGFNDGSLLGSDNVAYHNNKTVEQVLDDLKVETNYGWYTYLRIGDFAIEMGNISVTPVANTPTKATVIFTKPFAMAPRVVASANTAVPGTTVKGVSTANITTDSVDIYVTRTNTTSTSVMWCAMGPAA